MKKTKPIEPFKSQMASSMDELRQIMAMRQSPGANGKLSANAVEVTPPGDYGSRDVRSVRQRLGFSQTVFAQLIGVSDALVRSWERGARKPAGVACRLLDQMRQQPSTFAKLVRVRGTGDRSNPSVSKNRPSLWPS